MTWRELLQSIPAKSLDSEVVIVVDGKNGTIATNNLKVGRMASIHFPDCKQFIVAPDEREWKDVSDEDS